MCDYNINDLMYQLFKNGTRGNSLRIFYPGEQRSRVEKISIIRNGVSWSSMWFEYFFEHDLLILKQRGTVDFHFLKFSVSQFQIGKLKCFSMHPPLSIGSILFKDQLLLNLIFQQNRKNFSPFYLPFCVRLLLLVVKQTYPIKLLSTLI